MPWKVETVMSRRKELVTLAVSEGVNMSELRSGSGNLNRGISGIAA